MPTLGAAWGAALGTVPSLATVLGAALLHSHLPFVGTNRLALAFLYQCPLLVVLEQHPGQYDLTRCHERVQGDHNEIEYFRWHGLG